MPQHVRFRERPGAPTYRFENSPRQAVRNDRSDPTSGDAATPPSPTPATTLNSEVEQTMIIMMPEHKVKGAAKRLRKVLEGCGIEMRHLQCLEIAARLFGFDGWLHYRARDLQAPFSPFDHDLAEDEFAVRDAFQMGVLNAAGLGAVAREVLDRVNPTGSWKAQSMANVA
jgi:hypothetical protein